MKIPTNVKTYDFSNSTIWFDDDGILYSIPKAEQHQPSREEMDAEMTALRKIIGNKKICLVLESNNNSKPPAKEERDYIAQQINSITKAMAIITTSPLSRMIANLFFGLKPPEYPVKMFTDAEEARRWIRKYVNE